MLPIRTNQQTDIFSQHNLDVNKPKMSKQRKYYDS